MLALDRRVLFFGQGQFLRHAADIQEAVELALREVPEDHFSYTEPRPEFLALGGGIGGLACIGFVGEWATKKLLDQIYDRLIKDKVAGVFDQLFGKGNSGKLYGLAISLRNPVDKTTVMIVSLGNDAADLKKSDDLIPHVLDIAISSLDKKGSGKTHTWVIESGQVKPPPIIASTRTAAYKALIKDAYPARPTKTLSS